MALNKNNVVNVNDGGSGVSSVEQEKLSAEAKAKAKAEATAKAKAEAEAQATLEQQLADANASENASIESELTALNNQADTQATATTQPETSTQTSTTTTQSTEQSAGDMLSSYTSNLQNEYNNLDTYAQQMKDQITSSTAELLDLNNSAVDVQTQAQVEAYANQLDQVKSQYASERAKLAAEQAQAADNAALRSAANGDRGGIGQKQYTEEQKAYDQQLYEIDIAQIQLENEINQAIEEAKASGEYTKLSYQLELASAEYERLIELAESIESQKISSAASLDDYNLQVDQIQKNAVLNKISNGITVTEEDMNMFGLYGTDAKTAANNINESQGVERQILVEQLKAYQAENTNTSLTGDEDDEEETESETIWSNEIPYSVAASAETALDSSSGLAVTDANGKTYNVYFGVDGVTPTREFQVGDTIFSGQYVYDGDQFVTADTYNSANTDDTKANTAKDTELANAGVTGVTDEEKEANLDAKISEDYNAYNLYNRQLLDKYQKYATPEVIAASGGGMDYIDLYASQQEKDKLSDLYNAWYDLNELKKKYYS